MPNRTSCTSTPAEARRIFHAIFGREAPAVVIDRFVAVSERLNASFPDEKVIDYYNAIDRVSDLEALEVACRYRGAIPLLSAKFRVMVYLAETVPDMQSRLVNTRDNLIAALWALVGGGLRTLFKLAKGFFLIARARNA